MTTAFRRLTYAAAIAAVWVLQDSIASGGNISAAGPFKGRAHAGIYMHTAFWLVLVRASWPRGSRWERIATYPIVAILLYTIAASGRRSVFFALAAYATVSKRDFSFLGKFLFVGVILLLVAMVANLFFQVPALSLALSAIAVLIFSLYLLYDLSNIVRGGETNYVMATMNLFLDIFNIFVNLLNLLMVFSGQRD